MVVSLTGFLVVVPTLPAVLATGPVPFAGSEPVVRGADLVFWATTGVFVDNPFVVDKD